MLLIYMYLNASTYCIGYLCFITSKPSTVAKCVESLGVQSSRPHISHTLYPSSGSMTEDVFRSLFSCSICTKKQNLHFINKMNFSNLKEKYSMNQSINLLFKVTVCDEKRLNNEPATTTK